MVSLMPFSFCSEYRMLLKKTCKIMIHRGVMTDLIQILQFFPHNHRLLFDAVGDKEDSLDLRLILEFTWALSENSDKFNCKED